MDTGKKKLKGDLHTTVCEIMIKRRDVWDKSDYPMNSSPEVLIYVEYLDTVHGIDPVTKLIVCNHYAGKGVCNLRTGGLGCIYSEGFKSLRDLSAKQPERKLSKEIEEGLAAHRAQ